LESVYMVTKHAKNTYTWLTGSHLPQMLALLQQEALRLHPMDAVQNGLMSAESELLERAVDPCTIASQGNELKSLCRLSQQFLHVFLVGNAALSLAEASEKISGKTWTEHELAAMVCKGQTLPQDPKLLSAMAAKGLKTKIRRLYDVSNVLTALGILTKFDDRYWARQSNATAAKPTYSWAYHIGPQILLNHVFVEMPEALKSFKTPFVDGVELTSAIKQLAPNTNKEIAATDET
jgi:hypothetical protein